MSINLINSKVRQCGFFEPHEFCRVKTTNSKIVSSVCWSYAQNKNILKLKCKTDLEIFCTRCLMLVKKRFHIHRTYKIFKTIHEANNHSINCEDGYEIISVEECPTILMLIEDEILFEFLQIINHAGCNLPDNRYLKNQSSQEPDSKNIINNPFAKLKEKFRK